jgi:ubiquinol-cytochrome c reductase cytochrome b subunit
MWPTYAFRSLSLLCAVAAVAFGLGGLVQINPVWLWGPFSPAAVTSPAQPDWYVGWLDGALRLFPPWEFRVGGYLVPSVFWPAIVLPLILFGVLYLYPWLERAVTHDRAEHHVLQRPRELPGRVAVGAYGITLFTFLLLAGANDIAARQFRIPLLTIIWFMRIATLVVPVVVAAIAFAVARSLKRSEAPMLSALPRDALLEEFEADLLGRGQLADGEVPGAQPEEGTAPEEEAPEEEVPEGPGAAPADLPEHAPVEPGEAPEPHPERGDGRAAAGGRRRA